jgi:hypothetical protein
MKVSVRYGVVLAMAFVAGAWIGSPLFRSASVGVAAAENDTAQALADLLAKDAIREQVYNYGRGIDRLDKQLTLDVWHPDGTADYGGQQVNGRDWAEGLFKGLPSMTASAHHLLESRNEVTGDTATRETIANTSIVNPLEERALQGVRTGASGISVSLIRGRYADRWSKRNGRWALDHRAYIEDFRTVQEVPGEPTLGRGARGQQDPSYAIVPF